jgi:hypothetical protein
MTRLVQEAVVCFWDWWWGKQPGSIPELRQEQRINCRVYNVAIYNRPELGEPSMFSRLAGKNSGPAHW